MLRARRVVRAEELVRSVDEVQSGQRSREVEEQDFGPVAADQLQAASVADCGGVARLQLLAANLDVPTRDRVQQEILALQRERAELDRRLDTETLLAKPPRRTAANGRSR